VLEKPLKLKKHRGSKRKQTDDISWLYHKTGGIKVLR
jgi:hypothetical protein